MFKISNEAGIKNIFESDRLYVRIVRVSSNDKKTACFAIQACRNPEGMLVVNPYMSITMYGEKRNLTGAIIEEWYDIDKAPKKLVDKLKLALKSKDLTEVYSNALSAKVSQEMRNLARDVLNLVEVEETYEDKKI